MEGNDVDKISSFSGLNYSNDGRIFISHLLLTRFSLKGRLFDGLFHIFTSNLHC